MGKQSRIIEVPIISCQKSVEAVKVSLRSEVLNGCVNSVQWSRVSMIRGLSLVHASVKGGVNS